REQLETERNRHQSVVSEARATAEQHRQIAHELAIKVESRRNSKESASAALARVLAQQQHLSKRRDELQLQIETGVEPLSTDDSALARLMDERAAVETGLSEARSAVDSLDSQLREIEHRRNEAQQTVTAAREAADAVRLA